MKGKVLFDLYDFQEKTLNSIIDKDRTVILKGRQLGLSTLIAAYALWLILFHWDKRVLVIATKESVAKKLVAKVEYMYNELPK
jgi:phage terminase large subunit-like protein